MDRKPFEEPILEKIDFLSNDIITQNSWWWDDYIGEDKDDGDTEYYEPDDPFADE